MRINDNGVGIEPALSKPGTRCSQRLHAEGVYPGVGAGLAICRRIARRHDGEVSFPRL